jgi:2-oxoglutarate dehydrogenase E2 component (dihydrolipoamide succinyltransferase)
MAVELKVPEVGESVTEVEIGQWLVEEGGFIASDEPVVEIESEKATVELPAPVGGTVTRIIKQSGEMAEVGEVIGEMEEGDAPAQDSAEASSGAGEAQSDGPVETQEAPPPVSASAQPSSAKEAAPAEESAPAAPSGGQESAAAEQATAAPGSSTPSAAMAEQAPPAPQSRRETHVMPSARRALHESGAREEDVEPTGPGGRMLKEDVQRFARSGVEQQAPPPEPRGEKAVRMSPIRRTIASRLVEAQQNAALLTTFNEIDMSGIKRIRSDVQEEFQNRYGVKLGFMSFFVRASAYALQQFPEVNAKVRGEEIIYHNYYDIGIAVGSGKGLVVPVLRDAANMGFAEIEKSIADFAARARENKLKMEELQGGTFTISNGGVYGSMLSTPIINPPQSGVLGMHAIQDRPVAVDGEVVVRPMMYVALTYDHRIVDGREAVSFLIAIKERLEKPALLFDF